MTRRLLALVVVTWLTAAGMAQAAFEPIGLRVDGGEESWHAEELFTLRWSNPPGVAAVHYRLRKPDGEVAIADARIAWAATKIEPLQVLFDPGVYTAEVWLEDGSGAIGSSAEVKLRFDDSRPGPVGIKVATVAWLGRTSFPLPLEIAHPDEPLSPSGIRGYAIAVDAAGLASPCAGAICTDAEIDLGGGLADDTLVVGELPEGTSYVHAVAVSGAGVPSAMVSTAMLRVDKTEPVTTLEGVPGEWSRGPVALTAHATDAASGMTGTGAFTAIRVDGGAPILATGDTAQATLISPGRHHVAFYARDAAGNVDDGGVGNGLRNREPRTAVVKIDRQPPRVVFGTAQDPADPELIVAHASDEVSGVDPERGAIEVRKAGSGDRFRGLPTHVDGGKLTARWNSGAFPAGEYEFRATAFDQAGNASSVDRRPDGKPMHLQAPLKLAVNLRARLQPAQARYGRGAWLRGRLATGRRTPLAGQEVSVVERFGQGAVPARRVTIVRTGRLGRFALHLPSGPSRRIRAVVAPTAMTQGARSVPLDLMVKGHVSLRVSSPVARVGGRPIVFRGRVARRATRLSVEGKAVELQFRLPGTPWSEFRTVRSDRHGRFHLAYRFSDDDSRGVRFQFRAYAPAQAGWPFEPAGSRPVFVRGI